MKIDDPELWLATTDRRVKTLWMAFDDLEGLTKPPQLSPFAAMGTSTPSKSPKMTAPLSPEESHAHMVSHMAARFGS